MALATKTVRYGWGSLVSVIADVTKTSLGTKTVYLPETTSRVIRSAFVVFSGQDIITATGGTVNRVQVSCGIDAVADSDVDDIAGTLAHTGENIALHWHADFTSYFATHFTGASHAVEMSWLQSQMSGTTGGYRNVSAELFITYEYDDAAATHIKSVVLPIESPVGALATGALTSIGTNQIPILTGGSGILPEAGITIRDYYFILEANEANAGAATDWTLEVALDAEGAFSFGMQECALASDRMCRWVWDRSASVPTTTAVHDFKARANALARANHMSIQLVVTYEFTPPSPGANRTINSILVPFSFESVLGGTAAADNSRVRLTVRIDEPGTITLRPSGVQLYLDAAAAIAGLNVRVGSQSYRAYTHNVAMACGSAPLQHRFDAGGAGGAGVTLARGDNVIDIDAYRTDTADLGIGVSGVLILNYESDTSTGGVSRHARTTWWHLNRPTLAAAALLTTVAAVAPTLAETNFVRIANGWLSYLNDGTALNMFALLLEVLSGDADGDGWFQCSENAQVSDAELGVRVKYFDARRGFFQRWWADTESGRAVLQTARRYRLSRVASTRWASLLMLVTYHSMFYRITGNVTDSAGGTVTLKAYRVSDGLLLGSTTRSGNGAYSIDVPVDDACFVEARESATYLGRSDNDTPTRIA